MSYVEYTDYPLARVFVDPDDPQRTIALCDSECSNMVVYDEDEEALTILFEARWRADHGVHYDSYTYAPVSYDLFEEIVANENSIGELLNARIIHTYLSNEATYDRVSDEDYEHYADIAGW